MRGVAALFLYLVALAWPAQAAVFPVADSSIAQAQRAVSDIMRNFWIGPPDTGFPLHTVGQSISNPFTIWDMSTVIDVAYEWWLTTGDANAALRVGAEWKWLQNSYSQSNRQGCGSTRAGGSTLQSGYYFTLSTAEDDAAWNTKTLLQIYAVTGDPVALADAIALQACSATQWGAANGGLYYDDSKVNKQIYQAQYAINALWIWSNNADAGQLAIAEAEDTFIDTNFKRSDGLYAHIIGADNSKDSHSAVDPPAMPGSPVCLLGNTGVAVFAAREYARTRSASWTTRIANIVTAMLAKETVTSQSGTTVWMNDCDAYTNATTIVDFAREAVPLLSASLQTQVKQVFSDTAKSILVNDRAAAGLYGGDWEGPLVGSWAGVGNGSDYTNVAVSTQAVLMLIAAYVVAPQ